MKVWITAVAAILCCTGVGKAQSLRITGSALMDFSILANHNSYTEIERSYLPDSTKFVDGIPHPNLFLTQEYGFLTIKKRTLEDIENDFMGLGITEKERSNTQVRLISNKGWDITFNLNPEYYHGIEAISLEFNADNFYEIQEMSLEFRKELAQRELTKNYLIENPYYEDEVYISSKINPYAYTQPVTTDYYGYSYSKSKNGIILVPNMGAYGKQFNDTLIRWVKRLRPEWFATSLFGKDIQLLIEEDTSKVSHADLMAALDKSLRFAVKEDIKKIGSIRLLETLKSLGVKIICLGDGGLKEGLYRTNLTSYGDALRNMKWASMLPMTGRGMVLIVPSSVSINHPYNLQDFIKLRNEDVAFYSITPFMYFKASDLNARNLSPQYSDDDKGHHYSPYQIPSRTN